LPDPEPGAPHRAPLGRRPRRIALLGDSITFGWGVAYGDRFSERQERIWSEAAGVPVELSSGEFTLLRMLLEQAGRVVSRSRMEQTLYGWVKEVDSNTIEVYIHHLRKKLGSGLIHTVRGAGYRVDKVG